MVGALDSFLQFIAAICFTITLDVSVFQRFWNADYYSIVSDCISKYRIPTSTPKNDDLTEFIKLHNKNIETYGRMQGAFLLLLCCVLIIYGMFESFFLTSEISIVHNLLITIILLLSLFLTLFNIFVSWCRVIVTTIIFAVILSAIPITLCQLSSFDISSTISMRTSELCLRISLILSVALPVGFRFLYNHLYTKYYPSYLNNSLAAIHNEYVKAKKSIKAKNEEMLPEKYSKAFQTAYMDKERNASKEEDIVAICADIYYEQITDFISNQPTLKKLFTRHKKVDYECTEMSNIEPIPHLATVDSGKILNYVKEYENLKNKPKMKEFCNKNGITIEQFREVRNSMNKTNQFHEK